MPATPRLPLRLAASAVALSLSANAGFAQEYQKEVEAAVKALLPELDKKLKADGVTTDDGSIQIQVKGERLYIVDYARENGSLKILPFSSGALNIDQMTALGNLKRGIAVIQSDILTNPDDKCKSTDPKTKSGQTTIYYCERVGSGQRDYHYSTRYRYSIWYATY